MKRLLQLSLTLFLGLCVTAQEKTISGTVTSKSDGLPLPGVNVIVKDTSEGVQTNFDGFYTINSSVGDVLEFSFIGMKPKSVIVSESKVIDVVLEEDVEALEEIVVVGYSCSSKVRIRGASGISSTVCSSRGSTVTPQSGQLTASEINDLEDWNEWLSILKKNQPKKIQDKWNFNLTDKIDVLVKTNKGLPVTNAMVSLYDDNNQLLSRIKTDAFGKVSLFKPQLKDDQYYRIQVISNNTIVGKKITNTYKSLEFNIPKSEVSNAIDVMFTIDATGSMNDEMSFLKSELNNIMLRLDKAIEKKRVALTFYRDKGDAFLVKDFDFSSDVLKMQNILKTHEASGGGDYEEAVEEALKVSMSKSWDSNAKSRILFLMLDAPPHFTESNVETIKQQIFIAQEKGIKIIPIVASDANKDLEFLMRFFSISTNGTYVFLTDDSGIGNPHLKPTKSKYQVEKLNDLIVRLIEKYSNGNS